MFGPARVEITRALHRPDIAAGERGTERILKEAP